MIPLTVEHLTPLQLGTSVSEHCGAIYIPEFGHPAHELGDLANIKKELLELPWETKSTARHECFMSEIDRSYTYGNRAGPQTYKSSPFSPHVKWLMGSINQILETDLNVCFLNKYDNEQQHLGWHADEFPGMRKDQPIIVSSFGAVREIWLKDKRGFKCVVCKGKGHTEYREPLGRVACSTCNEVGYTKINMWHGKRQPDDQRVKLGEASLFIMPPGYQETHFHRIPKHDRPCDWRISLTFRSFT